MNSKNNCGIYYIQNTKNGKLYVGQSKRLNERRNRHFYQLRHNKHWNSHLQNSFNKYGEENFRYGVIQYCNESELDELEIAYMKLFNVKKHGFNISDGGHDGGWKKDYAHIKLSSFNRQGERMYSLVYQNQMIRRNNIQFLKELLETYFDETYYLKEGYTFDDLKREAKKRMKTTPFIKEARIVNRGKMNKKPNYSIKYDGKCIKNSIYKDCLEYLMNKYFDEHHILKEGFSISDIKKERADKVGIC